MVFIEKETEKELELPVEELVNKISSFILDCEKCPYETEINVLLTDSEGIREMNREQRGIDKTTDVLSFPNVVFRIPGDFSIIEAHQADFFNPDSGELILGDIVINTDRVYEQAEEYGHGIKREFSFLVAHSMYHLCGYDHMKEDEAAVMEEKQEQVLNELKILRD